jgi:hypothetical protein
MSDTGVTHTGGFSAANMTSVQPCIAPVNSLPGWDNAPDRDPDSGAGKEKLAWWFALISANHQAFWLQGNVYSR